MVSELTLPVTLIATLGSEPQVVTAALDLLLAQGQAVRRVIVVHTLAGQGPVAAAPEILRQEFQCPPYAGQISLELQPILDEQGRPLADVSDAVAARPAFRILYNRVRLARRGGQRLHLCIAGGRKTLAIFGALAAQLLFDDEDRLWHLYSDGEFLASKRLHPLPGDRVHLLEVPVVQWSPISPVLLDLGAIEDPFVALERQRALRLAERMTEARSFVRGVLSRAEGRVVLLLAREGLSDPELAARLGLSPRTVEVHLRSAYQKAADHWDLAEVNRSQLILLLGLYALGEGN